MAVEAVNNIKYEIVLNKRALETRRQVMLAEINKEIEMLDKFEKWIEYIEKELEKEGGSD